MIAPSRRPSHCGPLEFVCHAELGDAQLRNYLMPVAMHPRVTRIWCVRRKAYSHEPIPKARFVPVGGDGHLRAFVNKVSAAVRLGRERAIAGFLSYNPIPHGLASWLAAKGMGKPVHFGFIGSDWLVHAQSAWGRRLWPVLRQGDWITAPGECLLNGLARSRFPLERLRVLPNGIELARFPVSDPRKARYDAVYAGRLIPLKNVDLILRAWRKVVDERPESRLLILGEGPSRPGLEALASELRLGDRAEFAGHVRDVAPRMGDARLAVIASTTEGFPFALCEGMAMGLVPVASAVGAIPDWIRHGENGYLFPEGNVDHLADCVLRLLRYPFLHRHFRDAVLRGRDRLDYKTAGRVYEEWFSGLGEY